MYLSKKVLFMCVWAASLTLLDTETGVAPLTMASCLLSVASSGEQLSALMGVRACHWPTSQREKEREGVCLRTCTYVYLCECACVSVQ